MTGMLAAHPVFQTPFEVARRFVDPASSSGHAPARTWTISNNAGSDVLLARTEPLETAGDSEIIATGTTLGGAQGALLFREARITSYNVCYTKLLRIPPLVEHFLEQASRTHGVNRKKITRGAIDPRIRRR